MPAEGGEADQVTENGGSYAEQSWDGEYLYYSARLGSPGIWRVPVDGGEEEEILSGITHHRDWAVGHTGIYYKTVQFQARHSEHTFWYQDLETAQSRPLYRKEGPFGIVRLAVSPSEEWLLFGGGRFKEADLMLVENFR